MSLSIAELDSVTLRYIMPKMFDNIFDSNPFLQRIMKGGAYKSQDGGTSIQIPLNYAQTTSAGWYSGADTLQTTDNENITNAVYQWASFYSNISLTEDDKLKNSGSSAVLNLLKQKSMIAEKTAKDNIGEGLYSDGSNAKSIVGLTDIIAIDQTVGGISQADNSWWQGNVDSATTTLTMAAMQALWEDCSIDNEQPTVALTTRSVFNKYYGLLQPQQRFTDSDTAKGGFQNLMFNGAPVIVDSHIASGRMNFVNEKHIHLFYHPKQNFTFGGFQKPVNQEVSVGRVKWMGALGSSNNRLHGVLTAITA